MPSIYERARFIASEITSRFGHELGELHDYDASNLAFERLNADPELDGEELTYELAQMIAGA